MVTVVYMTAGGEDACERAPPCAGTFLLTGGSGSVVPEVQPSQNELGLA